MLKGSRGVLSRRSSSTASATRRERAPPDSCPRPGGARPNNPPYALDGIDNGPALNAMFDRYLEWYWRRARVCVFGRRVDTSARCAVAGTPELSRQVAAFLVGDIASVRA